MRHDVTIDKRQVTCPNASVIGYGKRNAQVGDVIRFEENGIPRIGRMIGRIAFAPAICGEKKHIEGYILAVCLGIELTHLAERWVDPATVTYVTPLWNQAEVCAEFFSDKLTKTPLEIVRAAASELWSTVSAYIKWRKDVGLEVAK